MSVKNNQHRTQFQDISKQLILAAADVPTTVGADFIAGRLKHTNRIQKITVHVRTVAAQAISFTDGAGVVIATLPASAVAGLHTLIDSEEGIALTEGEELDITGAAGVAATIKVDGFRQLTGVLTAAELASS
jgi:hypothetical protein